MGIHQKLKRSGFGLLNWTFGKVVATRLEIGDAPRALKYLALSSLVSRAVPSELPLTAHELSVFSQNGEDGVIFELCHRIQPLPVFVEFGIERGCQGNCVLLADVFGWSGFFIEPNEYDFPQLQRKYASNMSVQTLQREINPQNVNAVFEEAGVPKELGVLSIDIDGNDYWVWRALDGYKPAIVIIEYNALLPSDEVLVQPYNEEPSGLTTFFGSSLRAMEELGNAKGYELVHTDLAGVNAFFVREDLVQNLAGCEAARHGINYYLLGTAYTHASSDRTDWLSPKII
jgi:hypothetical protein